MTWEFMRLALTRRRRTNERASPFATQLLLVQQRGTVGTLKVGAGRKERGRTLYCTARHCDLPQAVDEGALTRPTCFVRRARFLDRMERTESGHKMRGTFDH